MEMAVRCLMDAIAEAMRDPEVVREYEQWKESRAQDGAAQEKAQA